MLRRETFEDRVEGRTVIAEAHDRRAVSAFSRASRECVEPLGHDTQRRTLAAVVRPEEDRQRRQWQHVLPVHELSFARLAFPLNARNVDRIPSLSRCRQSLTNLRLSPIALEQRMGQ